MKWSKYALRLGQILLLFVLGYYLIYRNLILNWQALGQQQWSFRWFPFTVSLLGVALTFVFNSQIWRMIVYALGRQRVAPARAAYIWFVSNLGRYLPGKIWQVAGMAVLARMHGLSAMDATASAILGQVIHLLAGAAVGLVFLPAELAGRFAPVVRWAWLGLPVVLLFLYPPFLRWLLALASKASGKPQVGARLELRELALWFMLNVGVWLVYGGCFYYFVQAVFPGDALTLSAAISVYAVGYIVGFLAFFAPGGIGVRELMFTGLLASVLGEFGATLVAVGSRLWLTLAEIVPVAVLLACYGLPASAVQTDSEVER